MPASVRALHITCFIVRPCSFAESEIASAVLLRSRKVIVVVSSPSPGEDGPDAFLEWGNLGNKRFHFDNFAAQAHPNTMALRLL